MGLLVPFLIAMSLLGGASTTFPNLIPECGHVSIGQPFIVGGRNATPEDLREAPWHVGLYRRDTKSDAFEQICAGTLVHPRVVVTAAHCLYSGDQSYGKLRDAKDLRVSIGSALRNWSEQTLGKQEVQHLNVSRLVAHHKYRGMHRSLADDIGLLILEAPVTVSAEVKPACVKTRGFEGPAVAAGSVGKVVGWGVTLFDGFNEPSPFLKAAELPYIPFEKCFETVPSTYRPYLTEDKFCAGHVNGSTVAKGDSGGGLTFELGGLWFLTGVVSAGAPNTLTFSTFTNVSLFSDWIGSFIETVEKDAGSLLGAANAGSSCVADSGVKGKCTSLANCPSALENQHDDQNRPYFCSFSYTNPIVCCTSPVHTSPSNLQSPQSQPVVSIARKKCQEYSRLVFDENGKDQCGVYTISLLGDWEAQRNEYPHMAMLGHRKSGASEVHWDGGGSLISPLFVLTAASMITTSHGTVRKVRLGGRLRRVDEDDQVIDVAQWLPHPDYKSPAAYSDIALLRLRKPARLGESVRPACLHTAPSLAATDVAVATGWGAFAFDAGGAPPQTLKKVGLTEVAAAACGRGYPDGDPLLPRGLQPQTQLCAGGKGRDVLCAGDDGGPLQLVTHNNSAATEPYCMHKIVGVISARPKACGTARAGLFARVYHFVPWIESVVWPDGSDPDPDSAPDVPDDDADDSAGNGVGDSKPSGSAEVEKSPSLTSTTRPAQPPPPSVPAQAQPSYPVGPQADSSASGANWPASQSQPDSAWPLSVDGRPYAPYAPPSSSSSSPSGPNWSGTPFNVPNISPSHEDFLKWTQSKIRESEMRREAYQKWHASRYPAGLAGPSSYPDRTVGSLSGFSGDSDYPDRTGVGPGYLGASRNPGASGYLGASGSGFQGLASYAPQSTRYVTPEGGIAEYSVSSGPGRHSETTRYSGPHGQGVSEYSSSHFSSETDGFGRPYGNSDPSLFLQNGYRQTGFRQTGYSGQF